MGRWTPDEHGCIYDEAGCFARLTPNKAERLASRHNADIDALTAELQRRLDKIRNWALANEHNYPLSAWVIAIAEGRDL